MEVGHCLTAVPAMIDDEPVTVIGDALLAGDCGCRHQEVAEDAGIIRGGIANPRDGFAGHDQNVYRSLRCDVAEGDAGFVAMDDVGGDLPVADFFEECLVSHAH